MSEQQQPNNGRLERLERLLELLVEDHVRFSDEHAKLLADHVRFSDEHAKLLADHVRFSDEHAKLLADHKQLLRAQVVLTDTVQKLAEAQQHTDQRLNALIDVVDGLVRRRPPQQP